MQLLICVTCYMCSTFFSLTETKFPIFQKRKGEEAPAGGDDSCPTTEKLTSPTPPPKPRKTKISDNEHSHGSFFLRVGAIGAFIDSLGLSLLYYQ